jgi:5-methylcytosine-specific restriction endonuclease McrA
MFRDRQALSQTWYKSRRWERRRLLQLKQFPMCAMCKKEGKDFAANVADHVIPHREDPQKFWFSALQSLCDRHHSSSKQQLENKGFINDIGDDGWPKDPNHLVYQQVIKKRK